MGLGQLPRTRGLELKRALTADRVTDLDLELPVGSDLFGRVARAVGTIVELEGVIPQDESLLAFLVVSGADAGVHVRMETSEVTQHASEVIAYGTAVTLA